MKTTKLPAVILVLATVVLNSSALSTSAAAPAARQTDYHICPMVTGLVPHIGGPIMTGDSTVLICGQPAARVGDMATCVGPPDTIVNGSTTVYIGGARAARLGDPSAHGGQITQGCGTVQIGG